MDLATASGSSPRVRGTHSGPALPPAQDRIIPASAGNTSPSRTPLATAPDHPRECGEHLDAVASVCCPAGSSPRVRGTRCAAVELLHKARIIPASAGNTDWPVARTGSVPDHPRECGEHSSWLNTWRCGAGSSPRVRGTRLHVQGLRPEIRIIPASAGNTNKSLISASAVPDHPRECGEHSVWSLLKFRHFPQVRIPTGPWELH